MTEQCAGAVMETVPLVMRLIRAEMRSHRSPDLSVPQFRALLYVSRRAGASLSDVAEHLGLTLPSTSRLVNRLVERNLLVRASAPDDRRRMILGITSDGQTVLDAAAGATRARLMERLATLSPEECETVIAAMHLLQRVCALDTAIEPQER